MNDNSDPILAGTCDRNTTGSLFVESVVFYHEWVGSGGLEPPFAFFQELYGLLSCNC